LAVAGGRPATVATMGGALSGFTITRLDRAAPFYL